MSSSPEYLAYVLDLLGEADTIDSRAMMGEYVLYSHGKVFGGVYDDRFLVKDLEPARALLPQAERVVPYPGAKEMLLIETDDRSLIAQVVADMLPAIPAQRPRKRS